MTLDERLQELNNHPAGFDVMRLVLAAGVIVQHSVNVTLGQRVADALFYSGWRLLFEPILPMFFALSGFLVAGSLLRCRSLVGFCGLRLLRIVPALAFEVALSALVLGPLVTDRPLASYLADGAFHSYFLNVLGLIHFELPGVFLGNPDPRTVNAQLWTVPFELECYVALAGLALISLIWRRAWLLVGIIAAQVVLAVAVLRGAVPRLEVTVPGRALVLCFLWGVTLFLFRDRIPWRVALLWPAAALALGLMLVPGGSYLLGLPAAYATIVVGLTRAPKPAVLFDGDYSYGLYLYGFPVQQTLVHLMPAMNWVANAAGALVVTFGFALLSWRLIEKPALAFRPALRRFENGLVDRMASRLPGVLAGRIMVPRATR